MSETLTKTLVDCSTGQTTIVALTEEEIAQHEVDMIASVEARAARQTADEALAALKASAKSKLIAGQPLTEEEAATIVI